jgi:hypothetical protein
VISRAMKQCMKNPSAFKNDANNVTTLKTLFPEIVNTKMTSTKQRTHKLIRHKLNTRDHEGDILAVQECEHFIRNAFSFEEPGKKFIRRNVEKINDQAGVLTKVKNSIFESENKIYY